jgi:hypothetical protein
MAQLEIYALRSAGGIRGNLLRDAAWWYRDDPAAQAALIALVEQRF